METAPNKRKVLNFLAPLPKTKQAFEYEVVKRASMMLTRESVCLNTLKDNRSWNLYNQAQTDEEKEEVIVQAAKEVVSDTLYWD